MALRKNSPFMGLAAKRGRPLNTANKHHTPVMKTEIITKRAINKRPKILADLRTLTLAIMS